MNILSPLGSINICHPVDVLVSLTCAIISPRIFSDKAAACVPILSLLNTFDNATTPSDVMTATSPPNFAAPLISLTGSAILNDPF